MHPICKLFSLLSILPFSRAIVRPEDFPELNIPAIGTEIVACRDKESHDCCAAAYSRWIRKWNFSPGQANVTSAFVYRRADPREVDIVCLDARPDILELANAENKEVVMVGPFRFKCTSPRRIRLGIVEQDMVYNPRLRASFPVKAWCETPQEDYLARIRVSMDPYDHAAVCQDMISTATTSYRLEVTVDGRGDNDPVLSSIDQVEAAQVTRYTATPLGHIQNRTANRIRNYNWFGYDQRLPETLPARIWYVFWRDLLEFHGTL